MSFFRVSAFVAAATLLGAGASSALPCSALSLGTNVACYDVTATVTGDNTGNFIGDTGVGTLTYSLDDVPSDPTDFPTFGNQTFFAEPFGLVPSLTPVFDFQLDIFGQTFTDSNDTDSSLKVQTFLPTNWSLVISETAGTSPTSIDNPNILGFITELGGSNLVSTGQGTLAVNIIVDDFGGDPEIIPLPASAWMLGTALLGAGAWVRRRRKPA
jgi:hypothetical protein